MTFQISAPTARNKANAKRKALVGQFNRGDRQTDYNFWARLVAGLSPELVKCCCEMRQKRNGKKRHA